MAITRGDTTSVYTRTTTGGTEASVTHTVDVGTTLLVVTTYYEGAEDVTGTPSWSRGGGENLTLVDKTPDVNSAGDCIVSTYALTNPTPGAGTVSITHTTNDNAISTAVNYLGTLVSGTMTDNIALLQQHVDDTGSTTVTFTSDGTSGNTLYAAGCYSTGSGTPVTVPANFTELFDTNSGDTAGADISAYTCDYIGGAADACSWVWSESGEFAAHYLEIFPDASAVPIAVFQNSNQVA